MYFTNSNVFLKCFNPRVFIFREVIRLNFIEKLPIDDSLVINNLL